MSTDEKAAWRWVILVSRSCIGFILLALWKSMGVFIPYFVEELDTSVASVGVATAFYTSMSLVLAPCSTALIPYMDPRKQALVGGVLVGVSTAGASTSTSIVNLTLWLFFAGIGQALVIAPSLKPLMEYFPNSFATVLSIVLGCSSVGMMASAPFTDWLIRVYGWRGALLLIGGLSFNVCVCAAALRPMRKSSVSKTKYRPVMGAGGTTTSDDSDDDDSKVRSTKSCPKSCCHFLKYRFDVTLFVDEPMFILLQVSFFIMGAVLVGWILFLVPHGIALGYDASQSAILSTFGGLGTLVARSSGGCLVDLKIAKPIDIYVISLVIGALSSLVDQFCVGSFAALCVLATISGTALGYLYTVMFLIARDVATEDRQLSAIAWAYLFVGTGEIFGGLLSGWIYDLTADYEVVFMIYGVMLLVTVPIMLVPRLLSSHCGR